MENEESHLTVLGDVLYFQPAPSIPTWTRLSANTPFLKMPLTQKYLHQAFVNTFQLHQIHKLVLTSA